MLIADSQVHIWAANTPERPWAPGTRPHRAKPLGHIFDHMALALSLSQPAHARPARLRRFRPAAHDVGQRFIAPGRELSRMCDHVH